MAREFSVVVGINATKAIAGGRQFKAGADQVNRSNRGMQRSTAKTTKRMTAMITTMGRMRGVVSLMFAGFLGVGGISAVVRTLATFEKSMSNVEALLGDRGVGGAMSALSNKARELGATTAFTASQAAEGMRFLTLAGFEALETFQAIGPALDLAQAGALGLGQAADIVSNIMQGFNINASRTGEVVDALAFVASRSNTNIQQLGEAMKFVAPVAGALKLSVQETSAALGLLGNSGLQASLAGTGLRRVLSGLLNPSKEADKVLAQMGLTAGDLTDALQDPNKGLVYVIQQLKDAGLGAAEAFTLFGQRGAPAILSLLGQTGKLEKFNEQMKSIAGTARTIGQVMIDNLAGDARIAISAMQEAILRLGDAGLTEWLRDTTQAFTGFIRGLAGIDQELEGSTEKVKKWAKAGIWLRDNVTLLRKALVLLVVYMNRALLLSVGASILAFAKMATTVVALVRTFGLMGAAGILLTTQMTLLRAAIISTGVGALVVAAGFLLDWILFSKDAESQNDRTTAAFNRQKSEIEDLAFQFGILTQAEKALAIGKLQSFLLDQELSLVKMERQMINATTATTRLAEGNAALVIAQERVNKVLKFNNTLTSDQFKIGSESHAALLQREEATLKIAEAELLLATTQGVSLVKLAEMRQSVEDLTLRLAAQRSVFAGVDETVEAYIARMNGAKDAVDEYVKALKGQVGLDDTQLLSLRDLVKQYSKNEKKIAELVEGLDLLALAGKNAEKIEKALGVESGTLARIQGDLNLALRDTRKKLTLVEKAGKKWVEILEDLRGEMDPLVKLEIELKRRTDEVIEAWIRGGMKAGELAEALKILNEMHKKNIEKLEETCKKTDDLTKCMSDNAKAMQTLWDQALRNIQDSFADAFRGAFESSSDFFDSILDAFKDMISQMLAAWAISGIANLFSGQSFSANGNSFSGIFSQGLQTIANRSGGGAAGGGAGGAGGAGNGGIFSSTGAVGSQIYGEGTMLGDAFASFSAGAVAFFQGAGALIGIGESAGALGIANTGIAGFGTSGSAIAGAGGSASAIAGNLGMGAIIGIISGYIADSLLGSRGDPTRNMIFSAIGGAIGAYYGGAIGAIIGGAIGSLVDNIFGGAKKLESASLALSVAGTDFAAIQTEVVSKQKSFFRGKDYTTTERNVGFKFNSFEQAFVDFANALDLTAEAFGGSSEGFLDEFEASLTLNLKRMNSDQISTALQNFMQKIMLEAIQLWLEEVEGIESHIHMVLTSLSGDIEEFARGIQALMTITALFDVPLVEAAAQAIADANIGVLESYQTALGGYREVLAAYDGSIESIELLVDATTILIASQIELIAVYQQIGAAISEMFQGSAQTVREALMSEEELYNFRKSRIDELVELAANTTDPEELDRIAREIDRLGLLNFNSLDESQRQALGPEFIEFFEGLDEFFGGRIDEGIGNVVQDQADLDLEVATRMEEAAQAIIDAAAALQREADRRERERERHRDEHHR